MESFDPSELRRRLAVGGRLSGATVIFMTLLSLLPGAVPEISRSRAPQPMGWTDEQRKAGEELIGYLESEAAIEDKCQRIRDLKGNDMVSPLRQALFNVRRKGTPTPDEELLINELNLKLRWLSAARNPRRPRRRDSLI